MLTCTSSTDYCDIFFSIVRGNGPDKAGVQLLYYTPGLAVGVYLSMFMCNRWPRKTFWPILFGSVIEAVGVGLMAWALSLSAKGNGIIYGMMALTGAGTALRFLPGETCSVLSLPATRWNATP